MRRAALQPLRAARRQHFHNARRYLISRSLIRPTAARQSSLHPFRAVQEASTPASTSSSANALARRHVRLVPEDVLFLNLDPPLPASLFIRNATVALLSSLVAYGAWFAATSGNRNAGGSALEGAGGAGPGRGGGSLVGVPAGAASYLPAAVVEGVPLPNASTAAGAVPDDPAAADPAASAEAARRAVVLENGEISVADLGVLTDADTATLSKEGTEAGRLVLEMLTSEQATERLRQHEQSFFVERGKGVARYDLVQLASNNPIEDDHVEKVVEVPEKISAADGAGRPDWMFWGVFDGHRYGVIYPFRFRRG